MNSQLENEAAEQDAPEKTNGKQPHLPGEGMAPPSHPKIDEASEIYQDIKEKHKMLTDKLIAAKIELRTEMEEEGLDSYRNNSATPTLLVTMEPSEIKVKVKREKEAE